MSENINLPSMNLEEILATLASLPKPDSQQFQGHEQVADGNQSYQATHEDPRPEQPQAAVPYHTPSDPRLSGRPNPQQFGSSSRPQERSSTPLLDPSTITDWKQGLRYVSKRAAQYSPFAPTIQKLMKDQEQNVKSWEAGRTRLLEDHKLKRENEQTHRAALSLPGILGDAPMLRTPEREKEELDQYDAKVYRASKAMVESQTSSLKEVGVPFFGIKPHLVVQTKQPLEAGQDMTSQSEGKVTKEELLDLQRRMLNHLADLYGD